MHYCCVPECTGRGGYMFPSDSAVRAKWIAAVRRQGLIITANTVVCRSHFRDEDFRADLNNHGHARMRRRLLPTAVPNIFFWSKTTSPAVLARRSRAGRRQAASTVVNCVSDDPNDINTSVCSTSAVGTEDQSETFDSEQATCGPDICSNVVIPAHCEIMNDTHRSTQADCVTVASTSAQTDQSSSAPLACSGPTLSLATLANDEQLLHYYTGLERVDKVVTVFHTLGPGVNHLTYYQTHTVTGILPINQFILMLAKLRQDLDYLPLSRLCGVSEFTARNVFITWINFCSRQWSEINCWPDKDLVHFYAPEDFRQNFPSTRLIIDGTEIPVQKPSNPTAQRCTFSSYKNRNTVKVLVGSTPGGLISYVSPAYGGSTSDRQIVERSGLPEKCDANDSIMADKGFNVQDLFAARDIHINIPTFFKQKNRMSGKQVLADRKISSKRVHIERIIGLMKTYKILTSPLPASETKLASHIITVCAMLCNFRTRIVPKSA